jgi:hypothetical protein
MFNAECTLVPLLHPYRELIIEEETWSNVFCLRNLTFSIQKLNKKSFYGIIYLVNVQQRFCVKIKKRHVYSFYNS